MHPRLIDLVNKKWERFARRIFFNRFLVTLSFLLIFLVTTILDQTRIETVKSGDVSNRSHMSPFFLQTKGEGDDAVITSVELPDATHQAICTVGRMMVLAGALWKGRSEFKEMASMGIRKYFQTTVTEKCKLSSLCTTIHPSFFRLGFRTVGELSGLSILSEYLYR